MAPEGSLLVCASWSPSLILMMTVGETQSVVVEMLTAVVMVVAVVVVETVTLLAGTTNVIVVATMMASTTVPVMMMEIAVVMIGVGIVVMLTAAAAKSTATQSVMVLAAPQWTVAFVSIASTMMTILGAPMMLMMTMMMKLTMMILRLLMVVVTVTVIPLLMVVVAMPQITQLLNLMVVATVVVAVVVSPILTSTVDHDGRTCRRNHVAFQTSETTSFRVESSCFAFHTKTISCLSSPCVSRLFFVCFAALDVRCGHRVWALVIAMEGVWATSSRFAPTPPSVSPTTSDRMHLGSRLYTGAIPLAAAPVL